MTLTTLWQAPRSCGEAKPVLDKLDNEIRPNLLGYPKGGSADALQMADDALLVALMGRELGLFEVLKVRLISTSARRRSSLAPA
jgi:hypothetical protein